MLLRITLFLLFSLFTLCSFAQFKYDIGITGSTFKRDRIQLNQRFYQSEKFSIALNLMYGERHDSNQNNFDTGDSTYVHLSDFYKYQYGSINVGVSRIFTIAEKDYYYASFTVGTGFEKLKNRHSETNYILSDIQTESPSYNGFNYDYVDNNNSTLQSLYPILRFDFSFGMDVPLSEHVFVNWGLNAQFLRSNFEPGGTLDFGFIPSITGGMRYLFSFHTKRG